jgi:hypothetical protein
MFFNSCLSGATPVAVLAPDLLVRFRAPLLMNYARTFIPERGSAVPETILAGRIVLGNG